MDLYNFQNNQSDNLAKQLVLSSWFPYNPEPHTMPEPTGAPWNIQNVQWGMPSPPQLVQFTGHQSTPQLTLHCKRKSLDVEPTIPSKQLITEEKMAAHLSGLHISSNYTPHTQASENVMEVNMEPSTSSSLPSSTNVKNTLKGHRIVLSEELKKLETEPLLPPSLLERLEKPCMSLVEWKPRQNIISTNKQQNKDEIEEEEDEEPRRRNGLLVAESANMDIEL